MGESPSLLIPTGNRQVMKQTCQSLESINDPPITGNLRGHALPLRPPVPARSARTGPAPGSVRPRSTSTHPRPRRARGAALAALRCSPPLRHDEGIAAAAPQSADERPRGVVRCRRFLRACSPAPAAWPCGLGSPASTHTSASGISIHMPRFRRDDRLTGP